MVAVLSSLVGLVAGWVDPLRVRTSLPIVEFATLGLTHALAAIFLESTGRQLEARAASDALPDWVPAQAEKNRRKAYLYLWVALPLFPIATLLKTRGIVGEAWSIGLLAFNLAFQAGTFLAEHVIMAAQARLVREVLDSGPPVAVSG